VFKNVCNKETRRPHVNAYSRGSQSFFSKHGEGSALEQAEVNR